MDAALAAHFLRTDTRQVRAALALDCVALAPVEAASLPGARCYAVAIGNAPADRFVAVAGRVSKTYRTLAALVAALTPAKAA